MTFQFKPASAEELAARGVKPGPEPHVAPVAAPAAQPTPAKARKPKEPNK